MCVRACSWNLAWLQLLEAAQTYAPTCPACEGEGEQWQASRPCLTPWHLPGFQSHMPALCHHSNGRMSYMSTVPSSPQRHLPMCHKQMTYEISTPWYPCIAFCSHNCPLILPPILWPQVRGQHHTEVPSYHVILYRTLPRLAMPANSAPRPPSRTYPCSSPNKTHATLVGRPCTMLAYLPVSKCVSCYQWSPAPSTLSSLSSFQARWMAGRPAALSSTAWRFGRRCWRIFWPWPTCHMWTAWGACR